MSRELVVLGDVPRFMCREDGTFCFGTYRGIIDETSFARVGRGVRMRIKEEKAWQWWGVIDEGFACGSAIVRLGYVSQGFIWFFDRESKTLLYNEEVTGLPHHGGVASSPISSPVARFKGGWEVHRQGVGSCHMQGSLGQKGGIRWDVRMRGDVDAMTAICPVGGAGSGRANVTVKQAGLGASGEIWLGERCFKLSARAQGMMDYTHGLLDRQTVWKWAIGAGETADGVPLSFNAVSGFNDGLENVYWLDGVPCGLGEVTITRGDARWVVEGEETRLELIVEGSRCADKDLWIASSKYEQPIGVWTGVLAGQAVGRMEGVAEDHHAKW